MLFRPRNLEPNKALPPKGIDLQENHIVAAPSRKNSSEPSLNTTKALPQAAAQWRVTFSAAVSSRASLSPGVNLLAVAHVVSRFHSTATRKKQRVEPW
jgi:hypothetical protein